MHQFHTDAGQMYRTRALVRLESCPVGILRGESAARLPSQGDTAGTLTNLRLQFYGTGRVRRAAREYLQGATGRHDISMKDHLPNILSDPKGYEVA